MEVSGDVPMPRVSVDVDWLSMIARPSEKKRTDPMRVIDLDVDVGADAVDYKCVVS